MTRRPMPWHEHARVLIGHRLSRPLHRTFNLLPRWEWGFARHEVSRLTCRHPALAGRRAVHITDLHLDRYQPRHDRTIAVIRELSPNWIFITGDLLNVPDGLPHLFRFLGRLRDIAPVYMTLGNHDHYSGVPVDAFAAWSDRHKIVLLVNQVVFLPSPAGELAVAGVDDPSLHRADLGCLPSPAASRFTVLLAHAPSILDQLHDDHGVDLILCGHSHGGQCRVPRLPPLWLPPGCNGRYAGYHEINGRRMYVNRGLGWSVLPMRWNCPPEIVAIDWTGS